MSTGSTPDIKELFEEFWRQFPRGRKASKADARRKFIAIVNGKHKDLAATADELIQGAVRYAQAMGDNHPYVKMPSTWLNQGCWEDEDLAPPGNTLPGLPNQHHGLQSTAPRSTRERSLEEDLTDRSWAD